MSMRASKILIVLFVLITLISVISAFVFTSTQAYTNSQDINVSNMADEIDDANPPPENPATDIFSSSYNNYSNVTIDGVSGVRLQAIRRNTGNHNWKYVSVTIPETIDGKPVLSIASNFYVYEWCTGHYWGSDHHNQWTVRVLRIKLPSSLRRIEANAFANDSRVANFAPETQYDLSLCTNLIEVGDNAFQSGAKGKIIQIADNTPKLKTIGVNAFKNAIEVAYDGNKSLKLPKVETIGDSAFEGCTGLKAVQLNQNSVIKRIGDRAFYGCSAIEDIFLPSSLDKAETNSGYIGSYAFAECLHLTDVISEANQLSDHIFYNDNSLTNLTLSTNVTEIPDYAFYGCTKYADADQFPNVTTIGVAAFYKVTFFSFDLHGCTSLGDLAFSESTLRTINLRGVHTVGASAFAKCVHLESIQIPATLQSIGESAFADCEEMTSATFGVDEFNEYMFSGCVSLSSVTFNDASAITTVPSVACERLTLNAKAFLPMYIT